MVCRVVDEVMGISGWVARTAPYDRTRLNRGRRMAATAAFQWDDAFRFDEQLDDDERAVRDAARDYCQARLQPRVLMAARHETFDRAIMTEMGELGLLGSTIE